MRKWWLRPLTMFALGVAICAGLLPGRTPVGADDDPYAYCTDLCIAAYTDATTSNNTCAQSQQNPNACTGGCTSTNNFVPAECDTVNQEPTGVRCDLHQGMGNLDVYTAGCKPEADCACKLTYVGSAPFLTTVCDTEDCEDEDE